MIFQNAFVCFLIKLKAKDIFCVYYKKIRMLYRVAYLLAIAAGPFFTVGAAWELADILNALMAVPNLSALLLLQNEVVSGTKCSLSADKKK